MINSYNEVNTNEQSLSFIFIDDSQKTDDSYSSIDQYNNNSTRYENIISNNIVAQFKKMQADYMDEYTPILTKLLLETSFDTGYRSQAELFFEDLYDKFGAIADSILQNIYLQNMYEDKHIIKHLLFIVMNLPPSRRNIIQIIPIAGLANPDIEIQDLSVRCFESWKDNRHLPALKGLLDRTNTIWFKEYLSEVIDELEVE